MSEEKKRKSESKWGDQLYTLNLTVVALVALVAIVGLTAIVLNGGVHSSNGVGIENRAGAAFTPPPRVPPTPIKKEPSEFCQKCEAHCLSGGDSFGTGRSGNPPMPPEFEKDKFCEDCMYKCGLMDEEQSGSR